MSKRARDEKRFRRYLRRVAREALPPLIANTEHVTFGRARPISDDFWREPVQFEKVTLALHAIDPKETR